jgi:hypothetical protein
MRNGPIPLAVHAMIEPVIALLLILAPFIFGFSDNDTATILSIVAGVVVLGTGMSTRWRLSLVKLIPLEVHRMLDLGLGVLLIIAPFVLGFSDESTPTIFFIVVGLGEIVAALATRWHPEDDLAADRHRPGRSEPLNS